MIVQELIEVLKKMPQGFEVQMNYETYVFRDIVDVYIEDGQVILEAYNQ